MRNIVATACICFVLMGQDSEVGKSETGPFGLEMGMSVADLRESGLDPLEREAEPGLWQSEVPRPHPGFDGYFLLIGPRAGLCQIRAVGNDIRTSSHGRELRAEFEDLVNQLRAVYGKPKISDALLPGSIWNEPRDFVMGLLKQERVLAAQWLDGPYRAHVAAVRLQAKAAASDTGVLVLQYDFANSSECKAELEAVERGVL